MSFTPACAPLVAPKPGSISASLRENKRGVRTVCLTVTKSAQTGHLSEPIGKKFDVRIGRGEHHGILRIEERPDGAFTFTPLVRGSARMLLSAWDLLPKEKRPAGACERAGSDGNALLLRLPSWAQPEARKLAVAAEFALRR